MSERNLHLSDDLAAIVLDAAARAYPCECCGLIEGVDTADGWEALAVHEAANVAEDPKRHFLIDPQVQFDVMRRVRATKRRILGCFHSHPGGAAEPSAIDRASAFEANFVYVIACSAQQAGFTLNAYVSGDRGNVFSKVVLVR